MKTMYKYFYFVVYDKHNNVVATFSRRWQAEKFAEVYKEYRVEKVDI